MATIDFFTNCWERDYREVLSPGFIRRKADQFDYQFRHLIVTVNNVADNADAKSLAHAAIKRSEVDEVVFVNEALPSALEICGLTDDDLGRVRHFTSFYLVMVTCTNADYIVNCAADIDMDRPLDWISPAAEMLENNEEYLVANPCWGFDPKGAAREALRMDGQYYVSQAYSDACFLGRRNAFAKPIYHHKHPAGKRYPLSHIGDVFEQRVDAYMRHAGLFRLTDSRITYNHLGELGASYPKSPLWMRATNKIKRTMTIKR